MRSFSLRVRVAVATALGATIIVGSVGFYTFSAISRNNENQLDSRLSTASQVLTPFASTLSFILAQLGDSGVFAVTVRSGSVIQGTTPTQLPQLPEGSATVNAGGKTYRVYTAKLVSSPDIVVSIGVPAMEAQEITQNQQRQVLLIGIAAIAAAAGLGWLFGGRAVRPLVVLTREVSAQPPQPPGLKTGVREADALAVAIAGMLQRVNDAQARTSSALDTARDFAAVSAHELRTPLTAMRTDIEVLRTLELDVAQQHEILGDLQRTQGRVEATLSALERLASGELSIDSDRVPTDVVEISDLVAQDAMRQNPSLDVRVDADPPLVVRGLPAGLRLALDNAIANAVRHGGATSIVISATRTSAGNVTVMVDDNGSGVPPSERIAVFERFSRGSRAAKGGSGLGLALVAQQAELHGGRAYFADKPDGGARLVLELSEV